MRSIVAALLALIFLVGCGMPSFLITPVVNTNKLDEVQVEPGRGFSAPKIAIVEVEGMLINAKSGGLLQPTENKLSLFTQQMEMAANDSDVKAVVLRINSPGGTVTCSDTMYQIVKDFRAQTHKPVIASTQEVCASGAYYLACGCDVIVAHPTSVVGSIGVIFSTFDISGAMFKLGINHEDIKSAPLKDMGSPFKPLDPEARVIMQGLIDEYYGRFVGVVESSRTRLTDPQKIKTATDGRVFSGQQALELGLVDRIGRLNDAVALAKEMSNSSDASIVMFKRPYGYSGSIYADTSVPAPQSNAMTLELPESQLLLPRGFYYLWQQ
ncbi:MAG TPA: signal peptide peptidase SppA [Tepidisphaeraceae bacterium]|nr:signal peptide peptidase SppA [Tepidisphaeraceae bacterium]